MLVSSKNPLVVWWGNLSDQLVAERRQKEQQSYTWHDELSDINLKQKMIYQDIN